MAELNKVTCGGLLKGNTGVPACYMDLSVINGIILTPIGYTLTKAEIASTLLSKLQTSTLATRANRIYPVLNFVDIKDNTDAIDFLKMITGGNSSQLFQKISDHTGEEKLITESSKVEMI